jgi:hypothetical protein
VALALYSGNRRRASKALSDQGFTVPASTLQDWQQRAPDAYAKVKRNVMPQIRELAAEQHSELAQLEGEAGRKLLERLMAEYEEIPARDLPGAIRNLDVGAAVNRDKAAMPRGENTDTPTPMRSVKDILNSLESKAPHLFENGRLRVELELGNRPRPEYIEGTATEQPDP